MNGGGGRGGGILPPILPASECLSKKVPPLASVESLLSFEAKSSPRSNHESEPFLEQDQRVTKTSLLAAR